MTKAFVDTLIQHMKHADAVMKVAPWMFEGIGDRKMSVRYVGLRVNNEWLEIFSPDDNLLLKFIYDRNSSYIEVYLANTTPFQKITTLYFTEQDKWEPLLGECKRRLKKDKAEYLNHTERTGNIYSRIRPFLK